jgi:putative ABC transport system permease protein
MLQLAPLIIRNVLRSKRRSILTLASTAVSMGILALLVALYQGLFYMPDVSEAGALRLITRHKVALTQPLPASHLAKIRAVPGVEEISPYSWFQGKYGDNKISEQFARLAVNADNIFAIFPDFTMPPEQMEAFKKSRTGCAVAEIIAQRQNLKLHDRIVIVGDIYPVTLELTVEAIFKHPPNAEQVFFHQEYLGELLRDYPDYRDLVSTYVVRANNVQDMPRIARAIDEQFANSPYPTRTESEKEFMRAFLAFLGNLKLYLGVICGAVTFTILLVSANAISMSVRERTRETAIMRTLGYTPGEILGCILGESVVISLLGGAVGLVLGEGLVKMLSAVTAGLIALPDLSGVAIALVLGIALVVGLVAAVVPALVSVRKNVVESLRFTG